MKYSLCIFLVNILASACTLNAQTLLGGGGFGTPTETGAAQDDLNKTVVNTFHDDNTGDVFSVSADGVYCITGGNGTLPVKKVTDKVPEVGDVDPFTSKLCIVMATGETYIYEPTGSCTFIETQVANRALNSATAMAYHNGFIWHSNSSDRMYQNNVDVGAVPSIVEMDITSDATITFTDANQLYVFASGTIPILDLPDNTLEMDTYGENVYVQTSLGQVFWFDDGGAWTSQGVLPMYLEGFQIINDNIVTGGNDIEIKLGVPTALPIKLISFEGKQVEDNIHLIWQTQSEINNDKFHIEHSSDGHSWGEIGTVKGHGNSTTLKTYTFEHQSTPTGINYYRLKQVDFDGRCETSFTILVNFNNEKEINIYPNPALEHLFVEIENLDEEGEIIMIYSPIGECVKRVVLNKNRQLVDLSSLKTGRYIMIVDLNGKMLSKQFVKQ